VPPRGITVTGKFLPETSNYCTAGLEQSLLYSRLGLRQATAVQRLSLKINIFLNKSQAQKRATTSNPVEQDSKQLQPVRAETNEPEVCHEIRDRRRNEPR